MGPLHLEPDVPKLAPPLSAPFTNEKGPYFLLHYRHNMVMNLTATMFN